MNVFILFVSYEFETIKLGIEVVKTLGLEKEFEQEMKISFLEYNRLFKENVIDFFDSIEISNLMFLFKVKVTCLPLL